MDVKITVSELLLSKNYDSHLLPFMDIASDTSTTTRGFICTKLVFQRKTSLLISSQKPFIRS